MLDPLVVMDTSTTSTTLPLFNDSLQLSTNTLLSSIDTPSLSLSSQDLPRSHSQSRSRSQSGSPGTDPALALKRRRNNVAARKYRQKKIDRINELELELEGVKKERDEFRIRLARQEAETAALRTMLKLQSGNDGRS
jgi:hypothetical protein